MLRHPIAHALVQSINMPTSIEAPNALLLPQPVCWQQEPEQYRHSFVVIVPASFGTLESLSVRWSVARCTAGKALHSSDLGPMDGKSRHICPLLGLSWLTWKVMLFHKSLISVCAPMLIQCAQVPNMYCVSLFPSA